MHAVVAIELLLKRKDDQHAIYIAFHLADAALLPCPQLWAHEINDGDAEPVQLAREAKIKVGKVDQDGDVRRGLAAGSLQRGDIRDRCGAGGAPLR